MIIEKPKVGYGRGTGNFLLPFKISLNTAHRRQLKFSALTPIFWACAIFVVVSGCGPRPQIVRFHYKEDGGLYKMRLEERDRYEAIKADVERQYDQMISAGEDEAVALVKVCESFDQRMMVLKDEPNPALMSARTLTEKDRRRICLKAEKAHKWWEEKQRRKQEAAEQQRQYEERQKEREAREAAEEQKNLERKAALQSTVITRAGIRVQVIDAANVGDDLGIDAEPAGTYIVVLIKATNLNKRSAIVTANDFWLADEKGRAYSIDVEGSLQYVITDPESKHKVALGQQLHPDVETYVACVFDMPEEAPTTLKLGLVFKDKKGLFPLYLKDDGRPPIEYNSF